MAGIDPIQTSEDRARRRLLLAGRYTPPHVIGSINMVAGCVPASCGPSGGPCGPDGCGPSGGPCGPDSCMPHG